MKSEQIGNVVLNLDNWSGQDEYTDGEIEQELLSMLQSGRSEADILQADNRYPILYHLSRERENILSWFPFSKDMHVLEIGAGCGAVTGALIRSCGHVVSVDLSLTRSRINAVRHQDAENLELIVSNAADLPEKPVYDVITLIGVLEYSNLFMHSEHPFEDALTHYRKMLKPGGQLLIAIENRFGVKYMAGAREDHHWAVNEGLYGYPHPGAKTFTKDELSKLLERAGFREKKFFGVWPDYKFCDVLFSDEGTAMVSDAFVSYPNYGEYPWAAFDPSIVMRQAVKGGLGIDLSNSFFVCAGGTSVHLPACVKYATKRKADFAMYTKIYPNCKVEKVALSSDGAERMLKCRERIARKEQESIIAEMKLQENETVTIPFYEGQSLLKAFRNGDRATRKELVDGYLAFLTSFSTPSGSWGNTPEFREVFGDAAGEGICLNPAPIDINFGNIIIQNGKQIVIDPEWTFGFPVPVKYILWRTCFLYQESTGEDISEYFEQYRSSDEEISVWKSMEYHFGEYVFGPGSPASINRQYMTAVQPVTKYVQKIEALNKGIEALRNENKVAWEQFSEREKWLDELRKEKASLHAQLKAAYDRIKQQQDEFDSARIELNELKSKWFVRLYQKGKH